MDAKKLTKQVSWALLAGILLGALLHLLMPMMTGFLLKIFDFFVFQLLDTLGKLFFRLLNLLVIPVILVSLVTGIAQVNDSNKLGKISMYSITLYLLTTTIAITVALLLSSAMDIGAGQNIDLSKASINLAKAPPIKAVLINIIPNNLFAALANSRLLQVMSVAILLALAILRSGNAGKKVHQGFVSFNTVVIEWVTLILHFAPLGVFALITVNFMQMGIGLLKPLIGYFFMVLFVLAIHVFFVYGSLLRFGSTYRLLPFLKQLWPAIVFAFGTSSSSAAIPVTLRTVRDRLKVSETTSGFVIPLGATINMDGTAIMQGVATVFIANLYQVALTGMDYFIIITMATLASIGTAGVPSAGMITLAMVLGQVGIPAEGIALILGIDRLLDMTRTAVNITGDSTIAYVIDQRINQANKRKKPNRKSSVKKVATLTKVKKKR
jgi:Na+/H+-dicarboxylate symporter